MDLSEVFSIAGSAAPWIGVLIAGVLVTQFLSNVGTWEASVPWQIRAYTRLFVLIVFLYLLIMMGTVLVSGEKLKIFTDSGALIGDLLKTVIGAIIGALSMTISRDRDLDGIPDNEQVNIKPPIKE
jgi:hypothetical protein